MRLLLYKLLLAQDHSLFPLLSPVSPPPSPFLPLLPSFSSFLPFISHHSTENKVYDNRRTLEDAIQLGKCLYSISGDNSYPMHDFYQYVLLCFHGNNATPLKTSKINNNNIHSILFCLLLYLFSCSFTF